MISMAKKSKSKPKVSNTPSNPEAKLQEMLKRLPKETQDKIKKVKKQLDKFKDEVLKKFDNYVVGIALLPPPELSAGPQSRQPFGYPPTLQPMQPPQGAPQPTQPKEQVGVLVLIDDSDSKRMAKLELKTKLTQIIANIAKDIDKNLVP
ncbi:hypothetical protein DRJ48_02490, partial [Candidatus Woesearchaeota archaeon]